MESVLLKNNSLKADKSVHTNKNDLLTFLRLLDTNPIIKQFLDYDSSFQLADKYLIAMVFIYFKRAQLNPEDYTYLNFFAGLCLAHSMEEDIELSWEIYPWALGPNEVKDQLPKLLQLKLLLWEAMNYRAAVSRHCCKQKGENHDEFPALFTHYSDNFFGSLQETRRKKSGKTLSATQNAITKGIVQSDLSNWKVVKALKKKERKKARHKRA